MLRLMKDLGVPNAKLIELSFRDEGTIFLKLKKCH